MSRQHLRRKPPKPRPMIPDAAAIAIGAALRGCNCRYDTRRSHQAGMLKVTVRHDNDCPAADTGLQLTIQRSQHQTAEAFGAAVTAVLEKLRP
ncbi:MAG: hypothetical protein WD354_04145 [Acidimicrobiia bacterium]